MYFERPVQHPGAMVPVGDGILMDIGAMPTMVSYRHT